MANLSQLKYKLFPISNIQKYESRKYSQNGEDGIIEEIFKRIGTTNKFFVEFGVEGAEGGMEFNGRKLIEEGWNHLLMDSGGSRHFDVKKEFITAGNINRLFKKYKVPVEFDMLSIDIDSNDYWVWKALDKDYKPRLVVIEYNAHKGPRQALSVKYSPKLVWDGTDYYGASLMALVKIARQKGYTLVGCDSKGVNAFFIRNDLKKYFIIRSPEELFVPPKFGQFIDGGWTGHPQSDKKMIKV